MQRSSRCSASTGARRSLPLGAALGGPHGDVAVHIATRTAAAIRRFGVDYVVVNGAFDGPYHGFLADWDPSFKPILEDKLGTLKDVFKRVYASDRLVIYRVEALRSTGSRGIPSFRI